MTTVNLQVGASADDARQNGTSMNLTNTNIIIASTTAYGGFRWTTTIPAGATIDSADVQFNAYTTTRDDPNVDIYFEANVAAGTFTSGASDITNRTQTTAKSNWNGSGIGTGWHTISVTAVVQEVSDIGAITAPAALVYGVTGTDIALRTYDHTTSLAAKLDVTYTEAGGAIMTTNKGFW